MSRRRTQARKSSGVDPVANLVRHRLGEIADETDSLRTVLKNLERQLARAQDTEKERRGHGR